MSGAVGAGAAGAAVAGTSVVGASAAGASTGVAMVVGRVVGEAGPDCAPTVVGGAVVVVSPSSAAAAGTAAIAEPTMPLAARHSDQRTDVRDRTAGTLSESRRRRTGRDRSRSEFLTATGQQIPDGDAVFADARRAANRVSATD